VNRRGFLAALAGGASALVVGAPAVQAADPARAPYGSGPLGDWTVYTPMMSTATRFQQVADNNGVLLLGDSIAKANAPALGGRVGAAGLFLGVNAWPSRPTEPAVDWLEANPGYIPDRGVVVACGSNDIFRPVGWWQQVSRVLALAAGRPVVWVSVYVDRWKDATGAPASAARRAADMRNSGLINEQLRNTSKLYPNLKIIEWYASLAGGHNESNIDAWLTDGVHTTAAGTEAWCDLVAAGIGL